MYWKKINCILQSHPKKNFISHDTIYICSWIYKKISLLVIENIFCYYNMI